MTSIGGKHILVGVSSSIACYKSLELIRLLKKSGVDVKVVMTPSTKWLVTPLTFETISGNPVCVDLFDREPRWEIEHISLAKWADLFVIAPATANLIGKLAHGIADDALTTLFLAYKGVVILAPAMNTAMYEQPVVQNNLALLRSNGIHVVEPEIGSLACGDEGKGRLVAVETLMHIVSNHFEKALSFEGKRFLVTSGPTREFIDDVRYISNPSSGKMGIAIAEEAAARGAQVILVLGPTLLPPPSLHGITTAQVVSAEDMWRETERVIGEVDVAVFAAAVSDYRPAQRISGKKKKTEKMEHIELEHTPDIAFKSSETKKSDQVFVGFAAEAGDNIEEARRKMERKKFNLIFLNDITQPGQGFASDFNKVTLISHDNTIKEWERITKKEIAERLCDEVQLIFESQEKTPQE